MLDMFIFTCNEIGFAEMSDLFSTSGGYVVMHEEFRDRIFRESFPKVRTRPFRSSHSLIPMTKKTTSQLPTRQTSLFIALKKSRSTALWDNATRSTSRSHSFHKK